MPSAQVQRRLALSVLNRVIIGFHIEFEEKLDDSCVVESGRPVQRGPLEAIDLVDVHVLLVREELDRTQEPVQTGVVERRPRVSRFGIRVKFTPILLVKHL